MAAKKLTLQVGRRGLKTLAEDAIKNDFIKGIVELVTNSDDTYCDIEKSSETAAGMIEISLERKPRLNQSILIIKDLGRGMDAAKMEQAIAVYGDETSGDTGRGVFGMGLKDTINAFGEGTVISICEGRFYRCTLKDYNRLEIEEPRAVTKEDRKDFGIPLNGTIVQIRITNPNVRIPIFDTLKQDIQTHVCLRKILSDPKRKLVLKDKKGFHDYALRYEVPENEILLEKDLTIPDFAGVKARLTVRRATCIDPLSQAGFCRTGGILIVSGRAIHQSTLFGFDQDSYADHLFGELECDHIYELQRKGEMVVTRTRDGLELSHPFSKRLWKVAMEEVGRVVKKIKEEAERNLKALEDEETRKKFNDAVKNLNDIATKHLGEMVGLGTGKGGKPFPTPKPPLDNFEFIPEDYRVLIGGTEELRLRIVPDDIAKVGDVIQITTESKGVGIISGNAVIPEPNKEGMCTVKFKVEGIQPGAESLVTARCNSKSAVAYVEVVSKIESRDRTRQGGLFKEIKYREEDASRRAWFEKSSGTIFINTRSPSIQLYFGPAGEGQGEAPNRVLVAELVTEIASLEIAREMRRTKKLAVPPGVDELEYFYQSSTNIKNDCAIIIHRAVVDKKNRRA